MNVVYCIINVNTGTRYIGSTKDLKRRRTVHRSRLNCGKHWNAQLQSDWAAQHGVGFKVQTIAECETRREAYAIEAEYIAETLVHGTCYNILNGGLGGDAYTHHPDYQRLLDERCTAMQTYFNALTPKQRKTKYGRSGELNGNWRGGWKHHCVCGNQMASTAATCGACRDRTGINNPFHGRRHTSATKQRLRDANRGRLPVNTTAVQIDGVVYPSQTEAARALDVWVGTIGHRLRSRNPKYADYKLIKA